MVDRRVVIHVGLAKTGTTYLQRLLADGAPRLREAGILVGSTGPGSAFRGAVEVRGSRAKFGLTPGAVEGVWESLCAQAQAHAGPTLLGHEVLAGASRAEVGRALAPLRGLDVEIVVTARDLGRQATAHWQEEVKLGDVRSFADFETEELRADTGPDEGPDAGGVRPRFWHAQDFADTLARWAGRERPGHLVLGPPTGAPPDELWHRFAEACGIDPTVIDATGTQVANPSLGRAQIALLRAVNAELGDRLDPATRLRVVKRGYAERVLAQQTAERPQAPNDLAEVLEPATARLLAQVAAAGWQVHGPMADLAPVLGSPGTPRPDGPLPPGSRPRRIARDLTQEAGGAPSRLRRAAAQLRRRATDQ